MAIEDTRRLMQAYVEKAMVDLPSLPTAVLSIVRATEKETVNTHEIEELVSTEPAIATKLLRVVNSAYFGMPREVSSISQAVAILGLQQVRNLVLSIGVFNALTANRHGTAKVQHAFWQQSFGTAACCSMLARAKRYSLRDQELLFVGGLLHDIGMLFLLSQFTSVYTQILRKSCDDEYDLKLVENLALHTDHAKIGAMLAEKWNFPAELSRLISMHETPGDPTIETNSALLHVADRIVYANAEVHMLGYQEPLAPEYERWLGYSSGQMEELLAGVKERVDQAEELLGSLV